MEALINGKDEIIMSLVHYFVTEENYTPINVQGVRDEIWLENLDGPYKIVRINSNYIHNDEQLNVDLFRIRFITKQIKKKTLSFKMNVLNICLNLNNSVNVSGENDLINTIYINNFSDIKTSISSYFPKIENALLQSTNTIDNIIKVTNDINTKTEIENKKFEQVFKKKRIIITPILMALCVVLYILNVYYKDGFNYLFGLNRGMVLKGEFYRIFTCAFMHGSIAHLVVNMYSLYVIGSQVETYMGKLRYIIIYLLSIIMASLFSIVFNGNILSVGASGALFGLMGSLLFFGYHYRLYLSDALKSQIIPIIILNLAFGFMSPSIDNAAHIGGLIGGYLSTMLVGVKYQTNKKDTINGIIVYSVLLAFLVYVLLRLV